eukprot:15457899-Alexandrium_andersonii.AAC.1
MLPLPRWTSSSAQRPGLELKGSSKSFVELWRARWLREVSREPRQSLWRSLGSFGEPLERSQEISGDPQGLRRAAPGSSGG